jgi:hypothetical protein
VPIGEHRVGLSGPAWEGVALSEVSVAVTEPGAGPAELEPAARRFHVFLPTEQPCPYPMLVNGAFATDLSRQRVRVTDEAHDYNAHLVRAAASLFRRQIVPALTAHGPDEVLTRLERTATADDETTTLLHRCLTAELADVPLLPTFDEDRLLTLAETVVPPGHLEDHGAAFREVIADDTTWQHRSFPAPAYCTGQLGRIAADHGAAMLGSDDAIEVLGTWPHPRRAALVPHDSGGFEVDPILELCVALWQTADPGERPAVEAAARRCDVFPTHRHDDGTVGRVAVGDDTAFYPARSAKHDLPLAGLQFLCHEVCWGALLPPERNELLGERMVAWAGLFDIRDFDFEEVMRGAVIPALRLDPDPELSAQRDRLQNIPTLAAICQLAGKRPKPDRSLRYERLGSDRALFNLSRMPLPCRTSTGQPRWAPAFSVYFGSDWIGPDSIEDLIASVDPDDPMAEHLGEINFLAPPQDFLGHLDLPAADPTPAAPDTADDYDEVDVDEDSDIPLETTERERWISFLSWIGVNHALRPVHFHDVEDRGSGWVSTKGLEQPQGWAFSQLGSTWDHYRAELEAFLDARPDADDVDSYLYQSHDLEHLVPLLDAATRDPRGTVGAHLLDHLVRHWRYYSDFLDTELALVGKGKWPSQRSKPPRAMPEERVPAGDNLWVHRLRRSAFCPTTHGPRRPDQTWLATAETSRRFGQRGRAAGDFLPLLELDHLDGQRTQPVVRHLGIRTELSPSTFTLDDARLLAERLQVLHEHDDGTVTADPRAMSTIIRPVYRELFELLSGRSDTTPNDPPLSDVPLLVNDADGLRFVPAHTAIYARSPGMKERSGVGDLLPIFVLEAHPAANAPLPRLFGVRVLDEILHWEPSPGEPALDDGELDVFRAALRDLKPALAARIRAERHEPRDQRLLNDFIERVEPVDELTLRCTLDDTHVRTFDDRRYFVSAPTDVAPLHAFIVWRAPAWPPGPDEQHSMAMGLADLLGLNLVEAFLAFLGADHDGRLRLLDSAGALSHLTEVLEEPLEPSPEPNAETTRTIDDAAPPTSEQPATRPSDEPKPAAPRVPLHDFSALHLGGEPLLISGEAPAPAHRTGSGGTRPGNPSGAAPRSAPGVDLGALDRLGMQIAATYEHRRLTRAGNRPSIVGLDHLPDLADADLVIDVSTPAAIRLAEDHPVAKAALLHLEQAGVSRIHPGFDLLTVVDGRPDRLIELKSSAIDARVQAMSWNEWKSARNSRIRELFWLYLVGNLRADMPHATPYIRAVHDPFGSLVGEEVNQQQLRRAVQLRVREFELAEHLDLSVNATDGQKT